MIRRKIVLTLHIWQEDGVWLGECVEFGTVAVTDANTEEAVKTALVEQVILTVKACDTAGELERFLDERHVPVHLDEASASQQWSTPVFSRPVKAKPQSQLSILEWPWGADASAAAYSPVAV